MFNPDKVLCLTVKNGKNKNVLHLDPERVVGLLSFPNATLIYVDVEGHNTFTVAEDVETIQVQFRELKRNELKEGLSD